MGSASGNVSEELAGARLPPRLAELEEPPARLYLRGELPRGPAVAIVGTRYPSPEAVAFTKNFAAELATAGVAVLSGGAQGIDTAAHEGALDVGGVTVVVAPGGFNRPFPEENGPLFRRIVDTRGAYLSLRADDAAADRGIFFARNACLVALAHAVVVTQLGHRSGAANAASWARQLGRPLFIVPHSPWVPEGVGALRELRLGGLPLDRPKEVLKLLTASGLHPLPVAAVQGELWPATAASEEDPVLRALKEGACHPDEISERTGLSLAVVQQRILTLALSGVLVPGPLGSLRPVTY